MAEAKQQRGALVVFEGLDRCGKSTQAQLLHTALEGSKLVRFPDRTTPIGKVIDDYLNRRIELNDQAIHLLFSANRWEVADSIVKALNEGTTVIVDRYSYSGMVFSRAKGLHPLWRSVPELGLPSPDVVVYLDITAEEAKRRGGYGQERYEKAEFQEKVRDGYDHFRNASPIWKSLPAEWDKEELQEQIKKLVLDTIDQVKDKPLKYL
jgi:dTMP kinase